jgi:hypothetical protein
VIEGYGVEKRVYRGLGLEGGVEEERSISQNKNKQLKFNCI